MRVRVGVRVGVGVRVRGRGRVSPPPHAQHISMELKPGMSKVPHLVVGVGLGLGVAGDVEGAAPG